MSKRLRNISFTMLAFFAICIGIIFSTGSMRASASTDTNYILRKTLSNSLLKCYNTTYMKRTGVTKQSFEADGAKALLTDAGMNEKLIYVPNNIANNLSESQISCQEVFNGARRGWFGGQSMPGLFSLSGTSVSNTSLESLGYYPDTNANNSGLGSQGCFSMAYTKFSDGTSHLYHTNEICLDLDSSGKIKSDLSLSNGITINSSGDGNIILSVLCENSTRGCQITFEGRDSSHLIDQDVYATPGESWNSFISQASDRLPKGINGVALGDANNTTFNGASVNTQNIERDEYYAREMIDGIAPVQRAMGYFMNGDTEGKFSQQEQYDLLDYYFQKLIQGNYGVSVSDNECSANKNDYTGDGGYAYYDKGQGLWCKVTVMNTNDDASGPQFNVVSGSMRYLEPVGLDNLLRQLSAWDFESTGTDPDSSGIVEGGSSSGTTGSTGDLAACFSGASSLGWIICPVLQIFGEAVQGMYDDLQNNYLTIDSEDMSTSNGTYQGWKIFRDFANVAFVIALVAVILSQVTGFGVSNYGIKKVLPTLIMVAILVNLSFYVCQLAVDLSNIVGSGVYNILHDLPVGETDGYGAGDLVAGLLATLGTVGAGAAIAGGLGAIGMPVILITLIPTLIISVIGTLFFFITLGMRQAGVVIMVMLSPLAIICYALPNTKKLYDRWYKIFSSLLMLYPICGALMGGTYFASGILIRTNNNNFFFNIAAILLQIVPFFFIPGMVRASMSAIGNIGEKVSRFGSRFGSMLGRGAMSTDLIQDARRRAQMRSADRNIRRIDAGRDIRSRLGMEGAARRRRQRLIQQYSAVAREDIRAQNSGDDLYDPANQEREAQRIQNAQLEDNIKAQDSAWRIDGTANRESDLEAEYENALNDLSADPLNRDAQVRAFAAQRRLVRTDSGRQAIDNVLSRSEEARRGLNGDAQIRRQDAMALVASDLMDGNGGMIKGVNRGMHDRLADIASNSANGWSRLSGDNITRATNPNGTTRTFHSAYAGAGVGNISAQSFADSDDNVRAQQIQSARNGTLTGDSLSRLETAAREVISDPGKYGTKSEVAQDAHSILNAKYAAGSNVNSMSDITNQSQVSDASAQMLANSSVSELDRIISGRNNGFISDGDMRGLAHTANKALQDAKNGTIQMDAETAARMRTIAEKGLGTGRAFDYTPPLFIDHTNTDYQQVLNQTMSDNGWQYNSNGKIRDAGGNKLSGADRELARQLQQKAAQQEILRRSRNSGSNP